MKNSLPQDSPENQQQAYPTDLGETILACACKAASDPLRLKILRVMRTESYGVLELCHILNLAQSKLSHHLKVLAQAGLVATRREGNSIFYRRPLLTTENLLVNFLRTLFTSIDQLPIEPDALLRMEEIRAERARSSLEFFSKNADKFKEHQALITENSQYVANIRELVKLTGLAKTETAIEIGPGEGDYLTELATRFSQVIALDNSASMLALAKNSAANKQLTNIQFIEGEPGDAADLGLKGSLVVCNMVLHHIASPAVVFQHTRQLLVPGGFMLVAELCPHDQQWVKESCGDLWFGFEPRDLQHWAESAGLEAHQSLYLSLRNGFQVQLHLFQKSYD